jgi:hypothetical protein
MWRVYGHYKIECPNYLKKQNKGMSATCYDSEASNKVKAFTSTCEINSEKSYENIIDEDRT